MLVARDPEILVESVTGGGNIPMPGSTSLPEEHPLRRHPAPLRVLLAGAHVAVSALQLPGCVWLQGRHRNGDSARRTGAFALLLAAALFPALTAVFHVSTRYR